MRLYLSLIVCGASCIAPIAARAQATAEVDFAQSDLRVLVSSSVSPLPDAPAPLDEALATGRAPAQQPAPAPTPAQQTPSAPPAQNNAGQASGQSSSNPQPPAAQTSAEQSQHEKAEEELKEQEKQRVMGVMATFNTTTNKDAAPLSSGQKFKLFFKSATDPWPFLLAGAVAGIGQAQDSTPEWGQGAQGYAKRFGAGYSDYFIGNFFGNALLPSMLHEDPRYFQKGTGSKTSRVLWAAASTVWCKRDNGGWGPNYSNIVGNLIGTAIGRVYYPPANRTVSSTISDGFTVSAEGIVGAEVIEFWPDMVRAHNRKKAEKLAREASQKDTQGASKQAAEPSATTPQAPKN
jgi:hypothetical protein